MLHKLAISTALAVFLTSVPALSDQDEKAVVVPTAEERSWAVLGDDPTALALQFFLENHPDGTYAAEATTRLAELTKGDIETTVEAEAEAETAPEEVVEEVPEVIIRTVSASATAAPAIQASVPKVVKFDVPLFHGESHIKGKTLKDLIAGSPLFPPIKELPEEYWKSQTCAACHTWTKVNLCEQAGFYLREDGKASLTKQHPYGGTFKENLRDWATGDCQ
ncbi:MAG: hypothetical protein AAF340_11510 [Pseudomonadota bacterium]